MHGALKSRHAEPDKALADARLGCRGYLLEAGLHQVLREQVPEQVQEGVQTVDLLVLGGRAGGFSPQFGVPRVDAYHQDDPEDGGDDSGGHVVHHGSATHPPTGAGV